LEKQKKLGCQAVAAQSKSPAPVVLPPIDEAPADPMDVEQPVVEEQPAAPVATEAPVLKKKSKKTSYKAMMAAMTKSDAPRDVEKEKEAIRKTTGGGAFSKIEKI
jgi:hypothetical protein